MSLLLSLEVDDEVQRALAKVEDGCRTRPQPAHLSDSSATQEKKSIEGTSKKSHPLLTATTANEYYRALAEPEIAVVPYDCKSIGNQPEVTDTGVAGHKERVRRWLGKVQYWMLHSDSLTGEINTLNKKLCSLIEINDAVKQQSTFLSSNASALITNAESCHQLCQGIEYRLQHFATVDRLSNAFSSPVLDPRSSTFRELLSDMDTTMSFLSNNRQFKSATQYLSRMHVTYQKALVLLRDACMTSISEVTASVKEDSRFKAVKERTATKRRWFGAEQQTSQLDSSQISVDEKPTGMDSTLEELSVAGGVTPGLFGIGSILSVEFRGKLHDTIPLIDSLKSRTTTETAVFLQDVVDSYILARLSILTPIFTDFMAPHLTIDKNLEDMIGHGTTYLLALAADEADLFRHIWKDDSKMVAAKSIIDSVSLVLYDGFRGSVIIEEDLQVLCNVIHSLNNSILSKLQASGEAGQLLASTLSHMCQDAQERLIFRVSMYIKDVIRPCNFTQQECLQYTHEPSMTTRKGSAKSENEHAKEAANAAQINNSSTTVAREGGPGDEAPVGLRQRQTAYFPALQNTLNLLSWVYKVVDKGVFTTLAQEAIRACTATLEQASNIIEGVPRAMLRVPMLDAKLFLVMHLLQLREQISPFDVDFQVTEKHVDFTNIRFHEISLASTLVDTKKNLEQELHDVCKEFIRIASRYAASPAESFRKILKERSSDPLNTPVSQVIDTIGAVVGGIKAHVDAQRSVDKTPVEVKKSDVPAPEAAPAPEGVPVPKPEGAPTPEGVPAPTIPAPEGMPSVPVPVPVPAPTPEGNPGADGVPAPIPAPTPAPVPAPVSTPEAPQQNGNGNGNGNGSAHPQPPPQQQQQLQQQQQQHLSKMYSKGVEKLQQVLTAYHAVMQGLLEEALPMLLTKMRFYLSNNYTMDVLFNPVRDIVHNVCFLFTFIVSTNSIHIIHKSNQTGVRFYVQRVNRFCEVNHPKGWS